MYGIERHCLAIVWPLSTHPINKNEIIVWDLQENPDILANLSAEDIRTRLFTRTDELPTGLNRFPIKTIGLNKSPFVVNDLRVLTSERASQLNIDLHLISQHAALAQKIKLSDTLWADVYKYEPHENLDVDEDLYSAFVPDIDRETLEKLRKLNGDELSRVTYSFNDYRLNELVFRYRARNFPESLNSDETQRWKNTCHQKIVSRLKNYWKDFDELYCKTDKSQLHILDKLKEWVEHSLAARG